MKGLLSFKQAGSPFPTKGKTLRARAAGSASAFRLKLLTLRLHYGWLPPVAPGSRAHSSRPGRIS
ncbi:MAG: hypothetical protein NDJ89_05775 [Oligoflexia bacterium]|nr:hypothetical protein [Oligoflexia bacterium]